MRKRYALLLTLLILSINIPIVQADGEEWLTDWDYRKSITIIGSIDGAQTDYQMGFFVYQDTGVDGNITIGDTTFGKVYTSAQDDFGDIRFTKANGITELDYWIEYISSANYSIIWVEVDAIPESPDVVNIYIYYGTEGESSTTSNMENTWVDSFDWTTDIRGDFTEYVDSTGSREYVYLQSITTELPMRAITHFMVTSYVSDTYGANIGWGTTKNADDTRDADDWVAIRFSSDTGHGADADTIADILATNDGGVAVANITAFDFSLNTMYVSELRINPDTPSEGETLSNGRIAQLVTLSIADAPDSINYGGYVIATTGGAIGVKYWTYDAVNDRIEWGAKRGDSVGKVILESPFSVFGKWTENEPEWDNWGSEEEEITDTVNISASIILLLFLILVGVGLIYGVKK